MASNSGSRNGSPQHSRASSIQHRPANPSHLRHSQMPPASPDERRGDTSGRHSAADFFTGDGIHPETADGASVRSDLEATQQQGGIEEPGPNARTALLGEAKKHNISTAHETHCGEQNCTHGAMSPRPRLVRGYGSFATQSEFSQDGYGGRYPEGLGDGVGNSGDNVHGVFGDAVTDGLMGPGQGNKMSTTQWLAKRHGVKNSRIMCVYLGFRILRRIRCDLLVEHPLTSMVGTSSTTSPLSTGYGSTAGPSCKATS